MAFKKYNPLLGMGIQDSFDPNNDVSEAVNTDAVTMRDTAGLKKWSIKHNTNIVKYDHYSPEPDNKLLNSGFETDLSSWTSVLFYILNDQFTTNLAAGAVNGTSAEPTGGTRTVVDTNSKLSISSSQLSFATGGPSGGTLDPGIWYSSSARAAGKVTTTKLNIASGVTRFGWGVSSGGAVSDGGFNFNGTIYDYTKEVAGSFSTGTDYYVADILRSSGHYMFIKGGTYTNWTLLDVTSTGTTASMYPTIHTAYGGVFTADNIRIPTTLWLPTPLSYDTFTRGDGTIGSSETTGPDSQTTPSLAWTGGAISSSKNVITPTLGSEMWDADAAAFTSGTYGWTVYGSNTIANVSNALEITYVDRGDGAFVSLRALSDLSSDLTVGQWYLFTVDTKINTGSAIIRVNNGATPTTALPTTSSSFEQRQVSIRSVSATNGSVNFSALSSGEVITVDNTSLKPLTLSSLFSSVSTSDSDVIADANVVLTAGTQAGLVLNLDSTSSPANFIIVYHDGTSVKVDEAVAGVYTNKQTTTVTYSAGAVLRAIREGTKLRVYYNNALVGAELTMTANTNTEHGLFSTYSGNSFDNFTLWPRGSGTTKFTDAPFEELTATRDTGTKYAGTASAKLVTGGVDATFLQSLNVGDTETYTLIGYAYTTGAAVTTADLNLYYNGAVISTSFTDMGSGWYRLTGTLTGANEARDYGVKVKAGKTVYLDTLSLQAGSGATIEVTFENSSSGIMNATFENNVNVGGDLAVGAETLTEANVTALKALI